MDECEPLPGAGTDSGTDSTAGTAVCGADAVVAPKNDSTVDQGLTLVHYTAQPKPHLTLTHTLNNS